MLICGIEEAGRGPIIGPMVMCGLLVKEEDEQRLVKLGVKDSKLLTAKQRESMFDAIKEIAVKCETIALSPAEIDDAVEKKDGMNLNWLEAKTSAKLINKLKPDKVIIDCPSPNINAYTSFIRELLDNKNVEILAAHHADVKYPIVSASSIIAKVTRDSEIVKLKKKIGIDFGSGYPADPRTQEFLQKYWIDYEQIFRHSWKPFKDIAGIKKQKKLDSF